MNQMTVGDDGFRFTPQDAARFYGTVAAMWFQCGQGWGWDDDEARQSAALLRREGRA